MLEKNLYKTMPRKQKKQTNKQKEKEKTEKRRSLQFVMIREKLTLLRFEPNFCQLVI